MKSGFIKFIIAMLVVAGLSQACFDSLSHDVSESTVRKGRKLTTALTFAPMENEVDTKSMLGSRGEAVVYNWNLFVFEDGILVGKYYKEGQNGGPAGDIEFNVKLDYPYDFLAVANVGNRTGGFAPGATKAQVEAMTISDIDIASNGLPMSWSGSQSFTRAQYEANQAKLQVNMTRLVSKYEIVVNKSNLTVWSFEVTSLTMKGAGSVKPFSATGTNAGNSNSTVNDQATASDLVLMNGGSPAVFYPVENVFSTPSALSGNTDPWNKVPGNLSTGQYPSYIEMTATARLTDGTALPKTVTYRFYLGQDATKDFNVIRNTSNKITFSPDDETIKNGHGGNWKIEPGPFSDSRTLRFERQTSTTSMYRIKAGTSTTEGIIHTPSDFKYYVTTGSSHITMRNPSTNAVITSGSLIDLSSVKLDIQNGIEEQTTVHLQTMDGAKYDDLYLDIYNAYLDIIDPIPPVRNWVWNAAGSGTAQTFTVATSIDFTMDVPTGWTADKSLVSDINGEKTWTITVYPNDPSTVTTAPGESLPLKFKTTELDDVVATLTRDFKPLAQLNGNIEDVTLTWTAEQGSSENKNVTVTVNDGWTLSKGSGDWSHWYMSEAEGSKTENKTITFHPVDINDNISPIIATATVTPVRGGEPRTITLVHSAAQPRLTILDSFDDWSWKQKDVNKTIHVSSNISWTATINDTENWNISYDVAAGTITVYPKNINSSTTQSKTATVTVSGSGVSSQQTSVRQTPYPAVSINGLSSDRIEWSYNDMTHIEYGITATNSGWLPEITGANAGHFHVEKNGAGTGFIVYPNTTNDTSSDIEAALKIKSDDADAANAFITVTLVHKKQGPYFTVSAGAAGTSWTWKQSGSGVAFTVSLSTNIDFGTGSGQWNFMKGGSNPSLFTVERSGNTLLVYPVDQNATAGEYSFTLGFDVPGITVTPVLFSQGAHPTISVSPEYGSWAWDEGASFTKTFTVTSNTGNWSYDIIGDDAEKFNKSRSGNVITVWPVDVNTNESHDNQATLRVKDNDTDANTQRDVSLFQGRKTTKAVTNVLLEYRNGWSWVSTSPQAVMGGETQEFRITVAYNEGDPDVLYDNFTVDVSGSGLTSNGTTTTSSVNGGTASVSVTYGGVTSNTISFSVTALTLDLSGGAAFAAHEAIDVDIDVTSNAGSWTASLWGADADKFEISPNMGTDDGTITVSAKGDNDDRVYSAYLTVTPDNSAVSGETVDIIQYKRNYDYKVVVTGPASVQVGSSIQLNATYQTLYNDWGQTHWWDGDWGIADQTDVTSSSAWSKSGPYSSYASVDNNGLVTGVTTTPSGYGVVVNAEYSGLSDSKTIRVTTLTEYRNLSITLDPASIGEGETSTVTAVADLYVDNVLSQAAVNVTSSTTFEALGSNPPVTQSGNTFAWNNSGGDETTVTIQGTLGSLTDEADLTVEKENVPVDRYFIDVKGFRIYDGNGDEATNTGIDYGNSDTYSVKAIADIYLGTTRITATLYEEDVEINVSADKISWTWSGDTGYASGATISNTNETGTTKYVTFESISAAKPFTVSYSGALESINNNHSLTTLTSAFTVTLPSKVISQQQNVTGYNYRVVLSPANPSAIDWNGTCDFSAVLQRQSRSGVITSTDGGATWSDPDWEDYGSWSTVVSDDSNFDWSVGSGASVKSSGVVTGNNTALDDIQVTVTASYSGSSYSKGTYDEGSLSGSVYLVVKGKHEEYNYGVIVTLSGSSIDAGSTAMASAKLYRYTDDWDNREEISGVSPSLFISSNTSVATVTNAGLVSGVYAGTASISASYAGYTLSTVESATITVNPVLESISLNKSSYLLNYSNLWQETYTVTAHYSNENDLDVTSEATVVTLPTGIQIDPVSRSINCSAVVSNQEFRVSYGGQTASALVSSVDSWILQGLDVSGLEGSAVTGSQFNFKIQGSYIKQLTHEIGQYQTILQVANVIDGDLNYINIQWNGSDEYQVTFKGYTQTGTTRSVLLKYINPKESGWTDNYIVITLNFQKTATSWTYTGFTTDENPIDMEF